jgi:hypothetical protein
MFYSIYLDNKLFNDHILTRVFLRSLKFNANFFRLPVENLWVRYSLKKKGEGGEIFIEPLGGVVIFMRSVENLWDRLGLRQGQKLCTGSAKNPSNV